MNLNSDMPSRFPSISIIVPVYNDLNRVGQCIDKLITLSHPTSDYEVIIVDNCSSDGTYDYLSSRLKKVTLPTMQLIKCAKPGSYAARNAGLKVARGDFIAFTDSDCLVSTNWLSSLSAKWAEHRGDTIIAGKVAFFSANDKLTEQSALDFENNFSMKQDENAVKGKCITANFFCSKALLDKFTGFNEKLKSGGDVEFSQRVVRAGGGVVYCEDAEVLHPSRNKKELLIKRKRVVGGTWDAELSTGGTKRKLRFCVGLVKMLLGRTKKTLYCSDISFSHKFKLIWLLLLIFYTSVSEFIKLQLGKETNRE
ncbi:glycosyltransferase [Alteromonas genovensis]|uniref:Glycosyltransferase n=1 Tax=Alteromonas genovensis TaxID=471225 RepID=A0A6N9TG58_9ALTE|nr:glycosyltransferase family A protein [Alteromonas genovensis]NDW14906.1 glycosyltransferase [Alteromonas genovensis]